MKKIVFLLIVSLNVIVAFSQNKGTLDLKEVVSGAYRPETIRNIVAMPDGEHYAQMNKEGTQITKYSFKTGLPVEVIFDVDQAREADFKHFDSYQFSQDGSKMLIATNTQPIYRHSYTADYYIYPLSRNLEGVTTNNKL